MRRLTRSFFRGVGDGSRFAHDSPFRWIRFAAVVFGLLLVSLLGHAQSSNESSNVNPTNLTKWNSRPRMIDVIEASQRRTARDATLPAHLSEDIRSMIFSVVPDLIAQAELLHPNLEWVFLGRDAAFLGDVIDAFYISRGEVGRVRRLDAGRKTLFTGDAQMLEFLVQNGLQSGPGARPYVIFDRTLFKVRETFDTTSQLLRLLSAATKAYRSIGLSDEDIQKRIGGMALQKTYEGNPLSVAAVLGQYREPTRRWVQGRQLNAPAWTDRVWVKELVDRSEWHDSFGHLKRRADGDLRPTDPKLDLIHRERNEFLNLKELLGVWDLVRTPEFQNAVDTAFARNRQSLGNITSHLSGGESSIADRQVTIERQRLAPQPALADWVTAPSTVPVSERLRFLSALENSNRDGASIFRILLDFPHPESTRAAIESLSKLHDEESRAAKAPLVRSRSLLAALFLARFEAMKSLREIGPAAIESVEVRTETLRLLEIASLRSVAPGRRDPRALEAVSRAMANVDGQAGSAALADLVNAWADREPANRQLLLSLSKGSSSLVRTVVGPVVRSFMGSMGAKGILQPAATIAGLFGFGHLATELVTGYDVFQLNGHGTMLLGLAPMMVRWIQDGPVSLYLWGRSRPDSSSSRAAGATEGVATALNAPSSPGKNRCVWLLTRRQK